MGWRSDDRYMVATMITCLLGDICAYGIVISILPCLLTQFDAHEDRIQSLTAVVVSVHAGSSMLCFPGAGVISDRCRSRRTAMLWALVFFTMATVLFFAATSISVLLLAKALQGGVSAVLWTSIMALCFDRVEEGKIGATLGTMLSIHDVGALLTPPLGGILLVNFGRWSLACVSLIVLSIAICMTALMSDIIVDEKLIKTTLIGSSMQYRPMTLTTDQDDEQSDSDNAEQNTSHNLLRHDDQSLILRSAPILFCLRDQRLIVAILTCIVQAAVLGAFDATIPLQASRAFGIGITQAGIMFLPIGVARLIFGHLGGKAVDCLGPKVVGVIFYSLMVPVLLSFSLIKSEPKQGQMVFFTTLLALLGLCIGGVNTVSFVQAGHTVRRFYRAHPTMFGYRAPFASLHGLNLMVYSFGMTVGSCMAGWSDSASGYRNMTAGLGIMACVAALMSQVWLEDGVLSGGELTETMYALRSRSDDNKYEP